MDTYRPSKCPKLYIARISVGTNLRLKKCINLVKIDIAKKDIISKVYTKMHVFNEIPQKYPVNTLTIILTS